MFFTYHQNNSGGSFDESDNVGITVIVEAHDIAHANARAHDIGIYFNGVADGIDCACCGDRWHEPYEDATMTPTIYGESVDPTSPRTVRIHYLGGYVERFGSPVR